MNNQQAFFIRECQKLIENQLGWGSAEQWKQRDFIQLSELILEKTGTSISLSTLKRIWAGSFVHAPQPATLNALARFVDFEGWHDFTSSISGGQKIDRIKEEQKKQPKSFKKSRLFIPVIFLILGAFLIFFVRSDFLPANQKNSNFEDLKFDYKILAEGLPNSVVFNFDIGANRHDSLFFQQSWDYKTKVPIPENSNNFTSIYYFPGYYLSKLFVGDQLVAERDVHIKTKGWQGVVYSPSTSEVPGYLKQSEDKSMLQASRDQIVNAGINVDKNDFWIRYYNIQNFDDFDGDYFQFSVDLKNNTREGGLLCQDMRILIFCERGMFLIPFCTPGCVSNLNLLVASEMISGKSNDLSFFGIDLNEWQSVVILSDNERLNIRKGLLEYNVPMEAGLGKIKGFLLESKGNGAFRDVQLSLPNGANLLRLTD